MSGSRRSAFVTSPLGPAAPTAPYGAPPAAPYGAAPYGAPPVAPPKRGLGAGRSDSPDAVGFADFIHISEYPWVGSDPADAHSGESENF